MSVNVKLLNPSKPNNTRNLHGRLQSNQYTLQRNLTEYFECLLWRGVAYRERLASNNNSWNAAP